MTGRKRLAFELFVFLVHDEDLVFWYTADWYLSLRAIQFLLKQSITGFLNGEFIGNLIAIWISIKVDGKQNQGKYLILLLHNCYCE